ncbi:MAG: hypothetical protein J0I20_35110, partial [Chloroflexi bacterium]|nr:hypothetical protein [Chloroflexota bacterium]
VGSHKVVYSHETGYNPLGIHRFSFVQVFLLAQLTCTFFRWMSIFTSNQGKDVKPFIDKD